MGYDDAYSKTSRSLWQHYIDKPTPENNNNTIYFPVNSNNRALLEFNSK